MQIAALSVATLSTSPSVGTMGPRCCSYDWEACLAARRSQDPLLETVASCGDLIYGERINCAVTEHPRDNLDSSEELESEITYVVAQTRPRGGVRRKDIVSDPGATGEDM